MKKKVALFTVFVLCASMLGGCNWLFDLSKMTATSPMATPIAETETSNGTGFEIGMDAGAMTNDVMSMRESMDGAYEEDYVAEGYYEGDFNTEEYNTIKENGFESVSTNPLSTFAADVDTGSYCNLRRMINDGYGYYVDDIPSGAIRTEELVNYFDYPLEAKNETDGKFSVQYEVDTCPWNKDNQLLVMTLTANDTKVKSKGTNFVYLIDTSGSMNEPDKLDMAIEGFKRLTKALRKDDTGTFGKDAIISVVTYAGNSDVLIDGCPVSDYKKIFKALDDIKADGGTNGSGGIEAAYECALDHYIEGGNNRVIIASDGDMNLGVTSQSGLVDLIKEKKESGVFLTTLGFGSGNYSDANMEQIADAGNGNYYYIDCIEEADHVLVDKLMQTTVTVAKDVKFQAEFNPNVVSEYRLIGYENRTMSAKDFEDDTKDGGEVGAGQQVTVVYELVPAGKTSGGKELKYQKTEAKGDSDDILTLSIRYKHPKKDNSELEEYAVTQQGNGNEEDWAFVAGLAEFSLVLHNSDYKGKASLGQAISLLQQGSTDELRTDCYRMIKSLDMDDEYEYNDYEAEDDSDYDKKDDDVEVDKHTVDLTE